MLIYRKVLQIDKKEFVVDQEFSQALQTELSIFCISSVDFFFSSPGRSLVIRIIGSGHWEVSIGQ